MVGQYDWRDFILSELMLDAAEFSPVESAARARESFKLM
jgi:hypothetical protein